MQHIVNTTLSSLAKKKGCGEWSTSAAIKARVQGCHLGTGTRLMGKTRLVLKSRDRRQSQATSLKVTVKCYNGGAFDGTLKSPNAVPTLQISRQGIHHCNAAVLVALLWSFQLAHWFKSTKTNLNALKCKQ